MDPTQNENISPLTPAMEMEALTLIAAYADTPIFNLQDANGEQVIQLGNTSSSELSLIIYNALPSTKGSIQIKPIPNVTKASATNCHFIVSFWPTGKLTLPSLALASSVQGWDLYINASATGTVNELCFLATQAQTISTRISLPPITMTYANAALAPAPLPITTIQTTIQQSPTGTNYIIPSLSPYSNSFRLILAPPGKEEIPLVVDFLGRKTILNDSSSQSLTLYLQNMDPSGKPLILVDLEIKGSGHPKPPPPPPTFTLWFDTDKNPGTTATGARYLGITNNIQDNVHISGLSGWTIQGPGIEGNNPVWTLTTTTTSINSGQPVVFSITGIQTTLAPGFTNLYFQYQNIPGYQDGIMTAQIEKSPTQYNADAGAGTVSQGPYQINQEA